MAEVFGMPASKEEALRCPEGPADDPADVAPVPVRESHIRELESRVAEHAANPRELLTLEDMRARLEKRT